MTSSKMLPSPNQFTHLKFTHLKLTHLKLNPPRKPSRQSRQRPRSNGLRPLRYPLHQS